MCVSVFVFFSLPLLLKLTLHLVLPYSIFSSCLFFNITPLILSSLQRSIPNTRSFSSHSFLSTPTPRNYSPIPIPTQTAASAPTPGLSVLWCTYCTVHTVLYVPYCSPTQDSVSLPPLPLYGKIRPPTTHKKKLISNKTFCHQINWKKIRQNGTNIKIRMNRWNFISWLQEEQEVTDFEKVIEITEFCMRDSLCAYVRTCIMASNSPPSVRDDLKDFRAFSL